MHNELINKNRQPLIYSVCLAVLLLLLKWLQWHFMVINHSIEVYTAAIALFFTALGIWLAAGLTAPKVHTVVVEKPVYADAGFSVNQAELGRLRLSSRELEVLQLMAEGLSNREIAERLFVSLNTVKTHSSNLFIKLEAGRRTQAVQKARQLGILP